MAVVTHTQIDKTRRFPILSRTTQTKFPNLHTHARHTCKILIGEWARKKRNLAEIFFCMLHIGSSFTSRVRTANHEQSMWYNR